MNKLDLSDPAERVFAKILRRQAQENGETAFLVNDDVQISFGDADGLTDRLAAGLQAIGVGKGDHVVLFIGNRPEMVLLALAINKLSAVWIPISTDYKGEWLLDALQRSRPKLTITDSEFADRILEVHERLGDSPLVVIRDEGASLPPAATDYGELVASDPAVLDFSDQRYGDTCAVLWTSGTTGKSKGVMQSYNGWVRPVLMGSPPYATRAGDVIYCALPLFHSGAWVTTIFRALVEGITVAIEPRFSVTRFWERVAQFGATQTFVLGAMGVFLWNTPESPDDAKTPLRVAGIVPMPPQIWKAFEARFGLTLVRSGLGQSEIQGVMNQPENRDDVPTYAVGFPPDDIDVRLCDDDGREVAPGEPGELCVRERVPHILFNGYLDDPDATAATHRGEWFLTGDLLRQDLETGAHFFVDRKKDVVRFAGRNVSTMEVESVARRHEAVSDVAAFGIASDEVASEQELKLDIVLEPGVAVTPEEICAFLNENGPYYFVPRYIEFVASLPYTPTNKVQKFELRKRGLSENTWDLKRSGYQVER